MHLKLNLFQEAVKYYILFEYLIIIYVNQSIKQSKVSYDFFIKYINH